MCGIIGLIDYKKSVTPDEFSAFRDSLSHRGPDSGDSCFISQDDCANIMLGHRRLAIIDLSANGNQPMYFDTFIIVFNGEVYNYREIKRELTKEGFSFDTESDTEVVLKAYAFWREKALDKFIGMFSIAIYDTQTQKIFLARDRVGVKPLFYYLSDDHFAFASELKAIEKLSRNNRKLNYRALNAYLNFGYISAPNTIWENFYKLEPGHYAEYSIIDKSFRSIQYWDVFAFYKSDRNTLTYDDAKYELKELFKSAFKYRTISDVPVGVFLSGGYDSSLVAAILQKETNTQLHTFSIGFENKKFDESKYASQVGKYLETKHTEYICTEHEAQNIIPKLSYYYDEPFGDSSSIPTILVSKIASLDVKVALSADGGDEIFCGYNKYTNALKANFSKKNIPSFIRPVASEVFKLSSSKTLSYLLKKSINDDTIEKFSYMIRKSLTPYQFMEVISRSSLHASSVLNPDLIESQKNTYVNPFDLIQSIDELSDINKMMAMDFKTYLPDDILTKVDRATMSVSIEGREPLLDHRIIEFAATMPDEFKLKNGCKKYILKDIVHEMIPKNLMQRPKMGFGVPVVDWMRNDLRELFWDTITDGVKKNNDIFNSMQIEMMLKKYANGDNSYFVLLWYLFVFFQWDKQWN